jgi:hypothetical protein
LTKCETIRDNLFKNITGGGGDNITIGERFRDRGFTNGLVDEFRVFSRRLTPLEVAQFHGDFRINQAIADVAHSREHPSRCALQEYYLATVDDVYQQHRTKLRLLREQRSRIGDPIQEIMVMRELPKPRPTFLLQRGAYDDPGDRVFPEVPAILPPFPDDQPRNRLGLARWLTAPDHALTSRVAVNRLWQMCFGRGIVSTPEDFGSQGALPTHPELLDWLARDLVDNGWNVKHMLKKMVMSATYRQSSDLSAESAHRDPENRLLARAPVYRWSAEMLRDNALAVSGLLVDRIGGSPARPYEVEVSFKPVKRDQGEGLYRRSLYTYWKRTGPAPAMMTLDASKRDVCRVRRERTTSPLQAFVLWNGPQFVEAARALAQRLMKQHDDTEAIMVHLFRTLVSRRPSAPELKILMDLYAGQLAYFEQEDTDRMELYLANGDQAADAELAGPRLAAIAAVANTLMNFDECVMKR